LVAAQENYYKLTAQREKFRGIQSLSAERARFLSEEAEEARTAGRDPEAMEAEAQILRNEEASLRGEVSNASAALAELTESLRALESALALEENRVSASLRAIADQREGTARQEGHINGLKSRIDATNAEIARITKSRDEAAARLQASHEEFALLETQIASLDASEPTLDSDFESAKKFLADAEAALSTVQSQEADSDKKRSGLE